MHDKHIKLWILVWFFGCVLYYTDFCYFFKSTVTVAVDQFWYNLYKLSNCLYRLPKKITTIFQLGILALDSPVNPDFALSATPSLDIPLQTSYPCRFPHCHLIYQAH